MTAATDKLADLERRIARLEEFACTCPTCKSREKLIEQKLAWDRAARIFNLPPTDRLNAISALGDYRQREFLDDLQLADAMRLIDGCTAEDRARLMGHFDRPLRERVQIMASPARPRVCLRIADGHRATKVSTDGARLQPGEVAAARATGLDTTAQHDNRHALDGITLETLDAVFIELAGAFAARCRLDAQLGRLVASGALTVEKLGDEQSREIDLGRVR